MEIIEKVQPKRDACRHCWGNRKIYAGIWGTFFEELNPLSGLDHISHDLYWFISQPYDWVVSDLKYNKEIQFAETHGIGVTVIPEGYHYEGTIAVIFYVKDANAFKNYINDRLDKHNRYEASIDLKLESMRFDKSYARHVINHKYENVPKPEEIVKSAIDFLTWNCKGGN